MESARPSLEGLLEGARRESKEPFELLVPLDSASGPVPGPETGVDTRRAARPIAACDQVATCSSMGDERNPPTGLPKSFDLSLRTVIDYGRGRRKLCRQAYAGLEP